MDSASIKNFFLICAKNALNAILTNAALMTMMSGVINIHSADGWWNIGKVTLGVIGAREGSVWLPVLLKWSATSADPSASTTPGGGMVVPPKNP